MTVVAAGSAEFVADFRLVSSPSISRVNLLLSPSSLSLSSSLLPMTKATTVVLCACCSDYWLWSVVCCVLRKRRRRLECFAPIRRRLCCSTSPSMQSCGCGRSKKTAPLLTTIALRLYRRCCSTKRSDEASLRTVDVAAPNEELLKFARRSSVDDFSSHLRRYRRALRP